MVEEGEEGTACGGLRRPARAAEPGHSSKAGRQVICGGCIRPGRRGLGWLAARPAEAGPAGGQAGRGGPGPLICVLAHLQLLCVLQGQSSLVLQLSATRHQLP